MSPLTDSETSLTLMEMLREDPTQRRGLGPVRAALLPRRFIAGAGPGACKRRMRRTLLRT